MKTLWAVARHTLSQCIRMRIAVAFVLLLGGSLIALPSMMKGDGTLAGSIRTFLSYSVSMTGAILSLLTILVTVALVSGDMEKRTIQLLAVKPVGRWQYMLGRWLGVVLLNTVLLGAAAIGIYLFAQTLRDRKANGPVDRRAVETEVFTARRERPPEPPDIERYVRLRIADLRERNVLDSVLETFMTRTDGDRQLARFHLEEDLRDEAQVLSEQTGPRGSFVWRFNEVFVEGRAAEANGEVRIAVPDQGRFQIEAPPGFVGRLMYNAPVEINNITAYVKGQGEDFLNVEFPADQQERLDVRRLAVGDSVTLRAEPLVQFRYKVNYVDYAASDELYRQLFFGPPGGPPMYGLDGPAPMDTPVTVTVPATNVVENGRMEAIYRNVAPPDQPTANPFAVRIKREDVSILYPVGTFSANFLRGMLLVFCQLTFLAAMGVFFSSFLSFPVAALCCAVLLGGGWMVEWLGPAVQATSNAGAMRFLGELVVGLLKVVLPNLSDTSPSQKFVDGLLVPWKQVAEAAGFGVALRASLFLAGACVIFQRRELAKVQV